MTIGVGVQIVVFRKSITIMKLTANITRRDQYPRYMGNFLTSWIVNPGINNLEHI